MDVSIGIYNLMLFTFLAKCNYTAAINAPQHNIEENAMHADTNPTRPHILTAEQRRVMQLTLALSLAGYSERQIAMIVDRVTERPDLFDPTLAEAKRQRAGAFDVPEPTLH